MRIAADLRPLKRTGAGRYAKNLFSAISNLDVENEYVFIMPEDYPEALGNRDRVKYVRPRAKYYSLQEQRVLPRLLKNEKVDLLHSPHFPMPWFSPCPCVVTIHDVVYLLFKEDLPNPVGRAYYSFQIRFSARHSRAIVTDSEFSKREIIKYLEAPGAKVHVVNLAADPIFRALDREQAAAAVKDRLDVKSPFFFFVGLPIERKNLRRLIEAFGLVRKRRRDVTLVLAGSGGRTTAQLEAQVERAGLSGAVRFLGKVSDDDLLNLYNSASALTFVSLYEGFGFPVLEAMACGTPVVTSNTTSIPEVAGDAACLVDPTDVPAIALAMERVLEDEALRAQLVDRGFQRAQQFTWRRTAERTLEVYRHVMG